jgi:hypothetical protein
MSDRLEFLFLTRAKWLRVAGVGLLVSWASYPWWQGVSIWAGCAAGLTAMVVLHMAYASAVVMPLAHVAILVCAVQYCLAPWAASYHPTEDPTYMISDLPAYFAYAGPVFLMIGLGWAVSAVGLHLPEKPISRGRLDDNLVRELHWMFWGGLGLKFGLGLASFGGLSFFVLLLANLRFVSAMCLMLLDAPGWKWRTVTLVIVEMGGSAGSGMFHELVLWSLGLFAVYAFTRRPRVLAFLSWLAVIAAGVFLLNDAKWQLRSAMWAGNGEVPVFGRNIELSAWNRPLVGGLCLIQSGAKVFAGGYSDESLGDMVMRFNQGWIVDRVMRHVPLDEPYARGETVISALKASLLLRVFSPDKQMAGGKIFMERFAGYQPFEDASMNLGFVGEMYANFGYWGGIVGCGVYALILGLLFRWVAVRAQTSPLWWAMAADVGHWALKAETDIGAVLNYLVKAAAVIFVITMCLPALRAELTGRPLATRKLFKRVGRRKIEPAPESRESAPATDR